MLAAGSNVVAFLIQIFSIAHPEDAEGGAGRQLRFVESEWSSHRSFFLQLESAWRQTR